MYGSVGDINGTQTVNRLPPPPPKHIQSRKLRTWLFENVPPPPLLFTFIPTNLSHLSASHARFACSFLLIITPFFPFVLSTIHAVKELGCYQLVAFFSCLHSEPTPFFLFWSPSCVLVSISGQFGDLCERVPDHATFLLPHTNVKGK